jgi:hypothetical protein
MCHCVNFVYVCCIINLLETKNLIAITTVQLKTETDLKHFPKIDSYFSYQAAQNES